MEKKTETKNIRAKLEKVEKKLISLIAAATLQLTPVVVSAEDNGGGGAAAAGGSGGDTTGFYHTIDTVLNIGTKGGIAVVIVGGIMFAFAYRNNSPDEKTNAIQTMISGVIVTALCAGGRAAFGLT